MKKLLLALMAAGMLAGCQTSTAPGASANPVSQVVRHEERINTYFDSNWMPVRSATPGGYYRKLYGKTANGHTIAQDFYSDTRTKQTDPFEIIDDAGLLAGDNSHNTGTIVWYDKQGRRTNTTTFLNGQPTGAEENYYPSGKLSSRTTLDSKGAHVISAWYENGQQLGEIHTDSNDNPSVVRFWHPNGQKANDMLIQGDKSAVIHGWDAQGGALSEQAGSAQLMRFMEQMKSLSQ